MRPIPPAPWHLTGQALACLISPLRLRVLVNYTASPVGPYLEHAVIGILPRGPSVVQMSVTSEASMKGGRALWGFPKVLEALEWIPHRGRVEVRRGQERFRFRSFGPKIPLRLSGWTSQIFHEEWIRVPCKVRGHVRLAFRGPQLALFMEDFSLTVLPPK